MGKNNPKNKEFREKLQMRLNRYSVTFFGQRSS
uniref:Uncharacterized protein n=1 Tax=Anguilla anguilla TaxID=7936 RepID=A0A0E9SRM2_ANGAN